MSPAGDIAITLFNVWRELKIDFDGTLSDLARIGYPAVQLSGFPLRDHDPGTLKGKLDAVSLRVAGCHVSYAELEKDPLFYVDFMKTMESRYIICPMLPETLWSTEGYRRAAGVLNATGELLRSNGMVLGYHNHDYEFRRHGGQSGLDILMENTDPALVTFEPDVYWIRRAGADVRDVLTRYQRPCPLVHIKDMEAGPEQFFAEIGEGVIDIGEVLGMKQQLGVEWYVVEQDQGRRPAIESAAISFRNLAELAR